MVKIRRFVLIVAILAAAVATTLLLNFTAPNPTGRRYSTETVDLSQNSNGKGAQGEQILSNDLGTPLTNDHTNNAVCVCNVDFAPRTPSQCSSCITYSEQVANYRIPDVTTDRYFAESKNTWHLSVTSNHDYPQLIEIAQVAREIGYPLWIYVRVDSVVDAAFIDLARHTGGDVIYYFAVPGYTDPVDQFAIALLVVSGTVIVVIGLGELAALRPHPTLPNDDSPDPEHSMKQVNRSVQDTEEFMERMNRLTHKNKDE